MSEFEVRIERLEPMRVACAHGFGPEPEGIAWQKIQVFMDEKGLTLKDARNFGFNNPDPTPGSPNYGYDVWITVGPEVEGTEDVEIRQFEGGLYAVTRFKNLHIIGQTWKKLVNWRDDSSYHCGTHRWLEHLVDGQGESPEEWVFDLYLPITE